MGTTELLLKALKNPLLARTSLPGISFDFKTSHAVGETVRTNLAI